MQIENNLISFADINFDIYSNIFEVECSDIYTVALFLSPCWLANFVLQHCEMLHFTLEKHRKG